MKKEFNHEKIKEAIRTILTELGDDPDREGLKDTPDRVARMYDEIFDEQMASLEKCNTYEAPRVCDTPMTKSLKCLTSALRLTQTTL